MASQGPNSPGTMATSSSPSWISPDNAKVSDNAYTTSTVTGASTATGNLTATNFGFTVPAGATIVGVVVEVERKVNATTRNPRDLVVQLRLSGAAAGSSKATATVWPTADAYATYGASNDLWGPTLAYSDCNDSTFGVLDSCQRDAGAKGTTTHSIDHVRITITYTAASGGPFPHFVRRQMAGGLISMSGGL